MQTRIYVVKTCHTDTAQITKLVEATSAAQAIRHVVGPRYEAHVASTKEVATAMSTGLVVERAGETKTIENQGEMPTT